ncbi:MAG TPA: ATP-binding protein [Usitatibacter sp.]|nr:ATP-binding protein [Usitatibacter sp.]
MSEQSRDSLEKRVLILAPFGRDAELSKSVLRGVPCDIPTSLDGLLTELHKGAAALFVAEEAIAEDIALLADAIARQPPWSDLPVLVLAQRGADSPGALRAIDMLGNVTLLERPLRVATLVTTVRAALRARERQYQTRAHLRERELADQRKDEFLATLAHELRNPLAPIRNTVNFLRLSGTPAPAPQLWEMMERQVDHMVRLVDDLMEVSRITRGKIELRKAQVDLGVVIAAAIETSRPLIDGAKHQLSVTLPQEPVLLEADAMRLSQVFSNLLNNSAKYTDPGGHIHLTAWREAVHAVVSVADNGVGMSPEALASVFDMFVQANPLEQRGQSGLGIGLTIVRSLVEMHGGTISAHSEGPGKGSELIVRLPLGRAAAAGVPARAPEAAPVAVNLPRVLVVDDNVDAADSLGALLQMLGAEVRVVHDGEAALAALGNYQPAVVFLDLGMPGMDGYELARRMRQRHEARDAKLIALTGWGQERDRENSRAAGFDHHLIKPADVGALKAVLSSVAR